MRTTLILRDDLVSQAMAMTRITEKTALVHAGLEALIAAEAARRLAKLGGSDRGATAGPRRRSSMPKRKRR
jgi:Arc/MetJ family transcription regulator